MHDLTLVLQIIAAVCFFIGWVNWQLPSSPRPAWNWMCGGFFWLLLSFMVAGFDVAIHAVGR